MTTTNYVKKVQALGYTYGKEITLSVEPLGVRKLVFKGRRFDTFKQIYETVRDGWTAAK